MAGPLLEAMGLACERGGRSLFQGIDLCLEAGQCVHVAGDNGTGKTSLLRILAGLLQPTAGSVRWRGRDIAATREEYGSELAFVGHLNGSKEELSVLENLQLEAAVRGCALSEEAALDVLARVGLEDFADLAVRQLSQGQRRRVALARLVGSTPLLWILDEPYNALDAGAVENLHGLIAGHRERGGIVILTAHQAIALPEGSRQLALVPGAER